MKTSIHPQIKIVIALVLLVAALPLAARADGDSDRQSNAAFYQALDRWESTPATTLLPSKQRNDVGRATAPKRASNHGLARRQNAKRAKFIGVISAPGPSRVIVTAPAPAKQNDGYSVGYPSAEATGAAAGQTVRRATNDL